MKRATRTRTTRRRPGFTLVEMVAVMSTLAVLLLLGTVLLLGAFKVRQAAGDSLDHLTARSALADQFRTDAGRAVAAPERAGDWSAGADCVLLRQADGRTVAYRWKDGELERSELPGGKRQSLSVGPDGTSVEFVRPGKDGRLVMLRLKPPARPRAPADAMEIWAALGGDVR